MAHCNAVLGLIKHYSHMFVFYYEFFFFIIKNDFHQNRDIQQLRAKASGPRIPKRVGKCALTAHPFIN